MDGTTHPAVTALAAAVTDASRLLRVPVETIVVEYLEAKDWPDSCLGLPGEDDACADVVTPGFLIILGDGFSYRTDTEGNLRSDTGTLDAELRVDFRQVGGIGGWSSGYHADTTSLSPDDLTRLHQFIVDTEFFKLPAEVGNGDPISDMFSYTIFVAHGRRHHSVSTYDGGGPLEYPALGEFLAWLKSRSPEPGAVSA